MTYIVKSMRYDTIKYSPNKMIAAHPNIALND